MTTEPALQWSSITDFKPGIVSRVAGQFPENLPLSGAMAPLGSATVQTVGCCSLPSGVLVPLPAQDYQYAWTLNPPNGNCSTMMQTGLALWPMSIGSPTGHPDIGAMPWSFGGGGSSNNPQVDAFTGLAWRDTVQGKWIYQFMRWRMHQGPNTVEQLGANVTGNTLAWTDGFHIEASSSTDGAPASNPSKIVQCRLDGADGATQMDTIYGFAAANTKGNSAGSLCTQHQQRLVGTQGTGPQATFTFPLEYFIGTNEVVQFSNINDWNGTTQELFVQEAPFGYGVICSQDSSDLFLVKHYGGGVMVQSDLVSPIVRRLPNVASTHGAMMYGCQSAAGFVYGQHNGGVYAWGGGDSSTLLSPQMADGFWEPLVFRVGSSGGVNNTISPYRGRFAAWKNFVVCPSGWVYDLNTDGWWQFAPGQGLVTAPADFAVDSIYNRLWATVPTFASAQFNSSQFIINSWNPMQGGNGYTWESNPLWMMTDQPWRIGELKEMALEVSGKGSITISFATDYSSRAPGFQLQFINPFTLNLTQLGGSYDLPTRVRFNVSQSPSPVRGTWIAFQLQVQGGGGITIEDKVSQAPMIHSISWGVRPIQHIQAA